MTTKPRPASSKPLLEQLAERARQLGAACVDLGVSQACVIALLSQGATLTRAVIRYDAEEPYVVTRATLEIGSVVIVAQRPIRPASPGEARELESEEAYFYLGSYQAVELINDD